MDVLNKDKVQNRMMNRMMNRMIEQNNGEQW